MDLKHETTIGCCMLQVTIYTLPKFHYDLNKNMREIQLCLQHLCGALTINCPCNLVWPAQVIWYHNFVRVLRASPPVHSMWLQTVKFISDESKCASLAQEIGFSAPNWCKLPWLVKGATQLCTSKNECNKLDLTTAQYFWLVDHNDWSRLFAISSPHIYAVPDTVLLVGLPKNKFS
jgi:hypothetical protein